MIVVFVVFLVARRLFGFPGLHKAYTKLTQSLCKLIQSLCKGHTKFMQSIIQSLRKAYTKLAQILHTAYTTLVQSLCETNSPQDPHTGPGVREAKKTQ